LDWHFRFWFLDLGINDRGSVGGFGRRHGARKWYADHHDVHSEERSDQAAAVLH
jgi:hypothetical protein